MRKRALERFKEHRVLGFQADTGSVSFETRKKIGDCIGNAIRSGMEIKLDSKALIKRARDAVSDLCSHCTIKGINVSSDQREFRVHFSLNGGVKGFVLGNIIKKAEVSYLPWPPKIYD